MRRLTEPDQRFLALENSRHVVTSADSRCSTLECAGRRADAAEPPATDRRATAAGPAVPLAPGRGAFSTSTTTTDAAAPLGYPALHHLTRPLRRAAAQTGDPERLHLWAGTGHRHATAEPVAAILARLGANRLTANGTPASRTTR